MGDGIKHGERMRQFYLRNYFFIRRLHSLLGIFPIGAFLVMHMFLNSRSAQSPEQYQWVPDTLDQIPYLWALELGGILMPLLLHAGLGIVIATQGAPNIHKPPLGWYANWAYTMQRVTGVALLVLISIHVYQTWWTHQRIKIGNALDGTHIEFDIFGLMVGIVSNYVWLVVYTLFVLIAAYHFGNGIYNFAYKWGFTTSRLSQRFAIGLGLSIGIIITAMGWASLWGFTFSPWAKEFLAQVPGWFVAGK
ncbi:hypothetical protein IIA79_03815 [bacterium]|nr:hypothetical protein [bacterium]